MAFFIAFIPSPPFDCYFGGKTIHFMTNQQVNNNFLITIVDEALPNITITIQKKLLIGYLIEVRYLYSNIMA